MVEVHNHTDKQTSGHSEAGHKNLVSDNDMSQFNKIVGRDNKPAASGNNDVLEFKNIYQSDTTISKQLTNKAGTDTSDHKGLPNKAGADTSERKGLPNKSAGDTTERKDGGTFDGSKPNVAADGGLKDKSKHPADECRVFLKDHFNLDGKPKQPADGGLKDKFDGQPNHAEDSMGKENRNSGDVKNGGPKENFNPPAGKDNPAAKSDGGKELEFKSFRDERSASVRENYGNFTLASAQPVPLTQPWTVHGDGTVTRGTTKSQPAQS